MQQAIDYIKATSRPERRAVTGPRFQTRRELAATKFARSAADEQASRRRHRPGHRLAGRQRPRRGLGEHHRRQSGIGPHHPLRRRAPFPPASPAKCGTSTSTQYLAPKEAQRMDTFIHYGLAAAIAGDARTPGSIIDAPNAERVGVLHRLRHRRPAAASRTPVTTARRAARARSRRSSCRARIINMIAGPALDHASASRARTLALVSACATVEPLHRHGDAHDPVRRRRRDGRRRRRGGGHADSARRLLLARARCPRATTTRPRASRPWDQRPRRLRARRRRRHPGARGIRAREGARRAHLLRARRLSA